jgi:hypothetical protein
MSSSDDAIKTPASPITGDWRSMLGLFIIILVGESISSTKHSIYFYAFSCENHISRLTFISAAGSIAGVGGGALFVPVFQALVGFGLKDATALSQAIITAGSLVSFIINFFKASPTHPSIPLIDWPLCAVLAPMSLAGVGIGVLLNSILPSYVLAALLVVLLSLLIIQSSFKCRIMWMAETQARKILSEDQIDSTPLHLHAQQDSMDLRITSHQQAGPSLASMRSKRSIKQSSAELSYESYIPHIPHPQGPVSFAGGGSLAPDFRHVTSLYRATSRRWEGGDLGSTSNNRNLARHGTSKKNVWMSRFMEHLKYDGGEEMGEMIRPNPLMVPLCFQEDLPVIDPRSLSMPDNLDSARKRLHFDLGSIEEEAPTVKRALKKSQTSPRMSNNYKIDIPAMVTVPEEVLQPEMVVAIV